MVFTKPLSEIKFDDIKALQQNKIHESDLLDYKIGLIKDDLVIKHVTAFANTRGGFIIFGVDENKGIPTAIPGIDSREINVERTEQILLSNISPRLQVKIKEIPHEDSGRSILIIQIPDSSLEPHMNLRFKKYYKRYEFEAVEMEEREVSDAYRRRFTTYQQVDGYIKMVLSKTDPRCKVLGQIVVIPSVLDTRLIDTSDNEALAWLNPTKINPQPAGFVFAPNFGYIPGFPRPCPRGVVCQQSVDPKLFSEYLELHRNGCVEYGDDVASFEVKERPELAYFSYKVFCVKLLHTLQFASMVYLHYNYFGDVRIVASIKPSSKLVLPTKFHLDEQVCKSNSILVDREFPSTMLESEYSFIASGIMNEIFNHFGFWRCHLFDKNGTTLSKSFADDP